MPSNKKFWQFRNAVGGRAELLLYGDIADQTWWGDEVTPKQFAEDLNALGSVSEIMVRINSGGGDPFAAQAIGNLLEQNQAYVIGKIDGLCASAATIVACHCNKVVAGNDTTYMAHPVKVGVYGYLDSKQLGELQDAIRVLRENIVDLYAKKTGREKDEVAKWMDDTSWWTAKEAKEHGFVDELVDEEEQSTVENRNGILFVNSISMGLPFDKAPNFVQKRLAEPPAANHSVNKIPAGQPGKTEKEEQNMEEIKTVDDLRRAYPALVDQIEQAAAAQATNEERTRIQDIEEMAIAGSEELVNEAKFTKPMSASDFAKAAMKQAKEKGNAYLDGIQKDADNGGANKAGQEPGAKDKDDDEFLNAIRGLGTQKK